MGIKHKLSIGFGLLFIVMLAALWLVLKLQLEQTLSQQSRTLGQILATQTADSVTELVLANDLLGLNVVIGQLTSEPGVQGITVTDVDGKTLASSFSTQASSKYTLSYAAPITLQDAVAGRVTLLLDASLLSNPLARPHTIFYLVIVLSLVLVVLLSWALSTTITKPIKQILELADDPQSLPADDEIEIAPYNEFGLLQVRLIELIRRQQALEEQVETTGLPDPEKIKQLNLRAERRMTSILVVEVANLETAIELLHPATLSTLLQEFQFYLRQAARLYQGIVIRIEGNRALVTFDTRHCEDDHAFNAICCGQLFLKLMQKIAHKHKANNAQSLEFKLVVHSGDAYFSPKWQRKDPDKQPQRDETAIGKSIDLAYTLLPSGSSGNLLASELSIDMAGGQKRFGTLNSKEIFSEAEKLPLMAYILTSDQGSHSAMLERQSHHVIPNATKSK